MKNAALLFKWWWRFSSENSKLWKKVVCSCNNLLPKRLVGGPRTTRGPGAWADIWNSNLSSMAANPFLRNGIKMMVGNGVQTRFWEDVWVSDMSLAEKYPRLYSISLQQNSFIRSMGWINLELEPYVAKGVF